MSDWNTRVIEEFRAGHERVADMFVRDQLLILHTIGARSGQERVSPLAFLREGERLLVVASAAGAPKHPAWYFNVVADPGVRLELWEDGELVTVDARAEVPEGAEQERLRASVFAQAPGFADYQTKTDRVIPVVVLERL